MVKQDPGSTGDWVKADDYRTQAERAEAAEAELAKLKGDIALAKTLILSQEHAHKIVRVLGG
jgi:small ligand-binding sensory domain FIST